VVPGNYSQGRAIGQDRVPRVQFPRKQFHSAPGIFTNAVRSEGRLVHIAAERLLLVSALAVNSDEFFGLCVIRFEIVVRDGPVARFAFDVVVRILSDIATVGIEAR
jgi:hypothetical protein